MTAGPRRFSIDPAGEFLADVPEYFFHLLYQALRRRDAEFDTALKPSGLTLVMWRALLMINRMQPCSMNALARVSTVERTTLTRTVDHLVVEGLVERCTPVADRRQVRLSLTDKGQGVYEATMALLIDFNRKALRGVEAERLREMTRGLHQVVGNLIEDEALAEGVLALKNPETPDAAA